MLSIMTARAGQNLTVGSNEKLRSKYPDITRLSEKDYPEWADRKYSADHNPDDHVNESQLQLAWGSHGKLWL